MRVYFFDSGQFHTFEAAADIPGRATTTHKKNTEKSCEKFSSRFCVFEYYGRCCHNVINNERGVFADGRQKINDFFKAANDAPALLPPLAASCCCSTKSYWMNCQYDYTQYWKAKWSGMLKLHCGKIKRIVPVVKHGQSASIVITVVSTALKGGAFKTGSVIRLCTPNSAARLKLSELLITSDTFVSTPLKEAFRFPLMPQSINSQRKPFHVARLLG